MAVCKTCGFENKGLPKGWTNWEFLKCYQDLFRCYALTEGDREYLENRVKRRGEPLIPTGFSQR